MRRKVNNSETRETKRYYEVPSEKVQEWSDTIENLTKQRDQFKTERENFEKMLNEECERGYQMEGKYHDMKTERDTLIDDLSWYKAKVSRLERENHDFKKRNSLLMNTVDDLDKENKALRLQSDTYFDEWQNEQTTSRGLREQCKEYAQDASKYLHLTEHIRLKAENNPSVDRYIALVNYIDRLESD